MPCGVVVSIRNEGFVISDSTVKREIVGAIDGMLDGILERTPEGMPEGMPEGLLDGIFDGTNEGMVDVEGIDDAL